MQQELTYLRGCVAVLDVCDADDAEFGKECAKEPGFWRI
jgi:hypothetical protein